MSATSIRVGRPHTDNLLAKGGLICLVSAGLFVLVSFNLSHAQMIPMEQTVGVQEEGPNNASMGGEATVPGEFPFQAAIYRDGQFQCSGAIIGKKFILTAKKCAFGWQENRYLTVRLGLHDLTKENEARELTIEDVRVGADLAMLITADYIPYLTRPGIHSIHLQRKPTFFSGQLILTGWGNGRYGFPLSTILKKQTVRPDVCRLARDGRFCSRQQLEAGPCQGDLGGPVIELMDENSQPELVGIFIGPTCSKSCNNPDCDNQYADIWSNIDWILKIKLQSG